ncbi:uncharacterized protein LOC110974811 [Acanthaster planci]|uniref:Uncharacterized protein LOC110974811 n=1 Tax=Acanthaster planci TaxID=133434 RepID=A0A8B7XQW1_ACAPL|nr:uncharacterized protein LOC110974811 [Acanthaster planci]
MYGRLDTISHILSNQIEQEYHGTAFIFIRASLEVTTMDVSPGHCWRCERILPRRSVPCSQCPTAKYCSASCRDEDSARHRAVECELFGKKRCSACGKLGKTLECSGCNSAWYCNTDCQRRCFPTHKEACQAIRDSIRQMSTTIVRSRQNYGDFPQYFGNTMAKDFLQLPHNEWSSKQVTEDELARDYHVLSAGCGDLRNTVLTAASLPDKYRGKLHVTLSDFDSSLMARNVLFLFMLVRYADKDYIASSLTTIWYSFHLSKREYDLIKASLDELVMMSAEELYNATGGLVRVLNEELLYMTTVWQKWRTLECQRDKEASINLEWQRMDLFINSDQSTKYDCSLYLESINEQDRKPMKRWFEHGLFLPHEANQRDVPFDNPTLTGLKVNTYLTDGDPRIFLLSQGLFLDQDPPGMEDFTLCVGPKLIPFTAWDCLRVREHSSRSFSSPMEMYHNYVTDLLQKVKSLILHGRLRIHVSLANCLDFPSQHRTLQMPNYDRIFTSNLADYLGFPALLQSFKPLLNTSNSCSVIATETMKWFDSIHSAYAPYLQGSQRDKAVHAFFQDMVPSCHWKGVQPTFNGFMTHHSFTEYYNNTPHFLQFLRADFMAGGPGVPARQDVPSFETVKKYNGMRMRDFRKGPNKLAPFQYRLNARDLNMLRGYVRAVEWCLPKSDKILL